MCCMYHMILPLVRKRFDIAQRLYQVYTNVRAASRQWVVGVLLENHWRGEALLPLRGTGEMRANNKIA